MRRAWPWLLSSLGVDPRGFRALAKAWLLGDLRGQHYARAVAQAGRHVASPLFWVVGQCLFLSCCFSLVMFARVDVFCFALVSLSVSAVVMASAFLVEFHEVVFDPADRDVLGHRPLTPRTYAAARFANILFYFSLLFVALNLFPLIVGAALRDAGPWYAPAYLVAALAASLTVAALVVLLGRGGPRESDPIKDILAWVQIVLVGVAFYGGQLVVNKGRHEALLFGAFPPPEIDYLPTTWLARFVDEAADEPTATTLAKGLGLSALALAAAALAARRAATLYKRLEAPALTGRRTPMAPARVGGLGGFAVLGGRGSAERAGFWLCGRLLSRDGALKMRCLAPAGTGVAAALVGLLSGQFGDPLREADPARIALPIAAVYLLALAAPAAVVGLSFCRDHSAAWLLGVAPGGGAGVARGACKALFFWIVTPLCVLFGAAAAWAWGDVVSALLHAGLAWALAWPLALAALAFIVPAPPFRLAPARGAGLGAAVLPMALLAAVVLSLAGPHYVFARSPLFWIAMVGLCVAASWRLGRRADARCRAYAGDLE